MLTSGTASGKSLAFNLPVLNGLAADDKQRALYLYPTKALAQDQARAMAELRPPNVREAIYDGDTPQDERPAIRRRSNLSSPTRTCSTSGSSQHKRWGDSSNLGWVVVDEAHTYRGVFGSPSPTCSPAAPCRRLYGAEPGS
jgi:DEAD/DEAH box helicase domain-containing protein